MSRLLNRRQRYALFKFFALLSLVRWYNILIIIGAQYLAAVFMLNPELPWHEVVLDFNLFIVALSTGFIVASGFIINAFYDLERDVINKPQEVVINRLLSQQTGLNFYFLFNTIGMILSFYVSKKVMLFNFLFSIVLWFYSHKLKKLGFLGNISAVLLTVAPFLVIVVYYRDINPAIFFYVAFIAVVQLTREIVKDVLAQKGDVIYGYNSVPLNFGITQSKRLIYTLVTLSPLPPAALYIIYDFNRVAYYFIAALSALVLVSVLTYKARNKADFSRINNILKGVIAAGILSIALV